jgi:hypothetical protein
MGNPEVIIGAETTPAMKRTQCQHGEKCFRKNPEHKAQFSHPGDADWNGICLECASTPAPPSVVEEGVEDRGLMGAVGGAAAVAGAGALAHQAGGLEWARKRPGLALAAGTAAVVAGAVAGSKLEDHVAAQHGSKPTVTESSGGYSHTSRPPCKYFAKGHCKDGKHCRHSHVKPVVSVPVAAGVTVHGRRLVVRVKNATGLRDTDGPFAGKSDPYVILRLIDANGRTVAGPKQTSVKDDTLNPVWNEDIVFDGLETPSAYTLQMNVLDKDTFLGTGHLDWLSADDKLGDGKVDLGTLCRSSGFQDRQIVIERRKLGLFKATLSIGLSTQGQWGN